MSELKDSSKNKEQYEIESLSINTIRTLAMDAVQVANSGHPGTPMALAPVGYTLWQHFLRFDPQDPIWANRDRFILSNGHASMLLYSLLHLSGVKAVNEKYENLGSPSVTMEDIKKFRQLDSKCPGHPEYRWTSGIETTTGPLGQGVANSVGMAISSKWMADYFNRPGFEMINFRIFAICGDGDMMEGVSSEAASIAGHLKLSNLCWIYDNNKITIEGSTEITFTEDIGARFLAYGWNVIRVSDANDLQLLNKALQTAEETLDRPTFIIVDSHIAWGSPNKQDTKQAHGEPLGEDEIRLTKRAYGWPEDSKFLVPKEVYTDFQKKIGTRGRALRQDWMALFDRYRQQYPLLAENLYRMQHRALPDGWDKELKEFAADSKGIASRVSSGNVLNAIAKNHPWLMGGAADLSPSTKTHLEFEGSGEFETHQYAGRNFHFGVREHAMCSILNGMALCKIRPFGAGFFIFSDYCRPPIRLAAIMEIPVIYIFTHDSIGVGEDGPTHQPVEQLPAMRAIPGLITIRPGDANEVVEAWRVIMPIRHHPVALILSRQNLPTLDRKKYASAKGVHKGAYVIADQKDPELIFIATGSELALAIEAHEALKKEQISTRVVSMPSWELFEQQSQDYRNEVLPPSITSRISIEQASTFGWERYVGLEGKSIGMSTFGASAPLKELLKKFGFTLENVIKEAKSLLKEKQAR